MRYECPFRLGKWWLRVSVFSEWWAGQRTGRYTLIVASRARWSWALDLHAHDWRRISLSGGRLPVR